MRWKVREGDGIVRDRHQGPTTMNLEPKKAMTLSEISPPGPNDNEVAVREGDDVVRDIATRAQ